MSTYVHESGVYVEMISALQALVGFPTCIILRSRLVAYDFRHCKHWNGLLSVGTILERTSIKNSTLTGLLIETMKSFAAQTCLVTSV